jgi:uncharacterized protein (UPF0264 family)
MGGDDMLKLMISIINKEEASIAYDAKADLIDIKNPAEGSLGGQHPLVIKEIVEMLPEDVEVSATVGDVPYLPCTIAQAAYAVASLQVDYVKIGFKGCKNTEEAKTLAGEVVKAVNCFPKVKIIVGCYADYRESGTLPPLEILKAVSGTGISGILIDTLSKDGRNLFDFMGEAELAEFVNKTHEQKLMAALAGSIKEEHVDTLNRLKADISGVRGAICDGSRLGKVQGDKIKKFMKKLQGLV